MKSSARYAVIGLVVLVVIVGAVLMRDQAPVTPDVTVEDAPASTAATAQADAEIEGTLWQAVEFNGKPLAADVVITMQLADGRIAGKSGCNRYTGPYSTDVESRSLQVTGPVAGTRMACAPAVMEVEAAFNDVLPKITAYRVDAGPVLVVFAGTEDVLHLKPAQAE